jgi:hypothetical protein
MSVEELPDSLPLDQALWAVEEPQKPPASKKRVPLVSANALLSEQQSVETVAATLVVPVQDEDPAVTVRGTWTDAGRRCTVESVGDCGGKKQGSRQQANGRS